MLGRRASYLLILPAAAIYCGLFVAAAFYFFVLSFWSVKSFRVVPDFTFKNYAKALGNYVGSAEMTLLIAFAIAATATLLGFYYAWLIRFRAGRWAPALLFIALVTLFGGYLMKIYAWKTMLGSDGAVNSALIASGVISDPIEALLYSPLAVIITLTHFLLPFAILPIVAALRGITDAEIESARDLGAGSLGVLRDVIVPRARTGIMAGFALCFLVSVGDYFTPLLVGGKMAMVGQLIAPQFGTYFNWPLGSAMSFSILAASLIVLAIVNSGLSLVGRQ
jgi:spermidine/putrescine transport system permease protein